MTTIPLVTQLAPLDYRYALDAAMSWVAHHDQVVVRCGQPELIPEISLRIPHWSEAGRVGLWVEPAIATWRTELVEFAAALSTNAPLVIVVSQPLARRLPERQHWQHTTIGGRWQTLPSLWQGLRATGFGVKAIYGSHSIASILLNARAQRYAKQGKHALADQYAARGRLHYGTKGMLAPFATVMLVLASKQGKR